MGTIRSVCGCTSHLRDDCREQRQDADQVKAPTQGQNPNKRPSPVPEHAAADPQSLSAPPIEANPWDTDNAAAHPASAKPPSLRQVPKPTAKTHTDSTVSPPHSVGVLKYPQLPSGMLALSKVQFPHNRADDMAAVKHAGSMSAFVANGGRFPIMMPTYNRAAMLRRSLQGLTAVRGVTKQDIFVIQDGAMGAVRAVLDEGGYQYHQKTDETKLRGGRPMDGAQRIAAHYGYALHHMFESAAPWAPAVIIAEDDFLFSVDYYEYFHAVATILEHDPQVWLASAWNDNGMKGCVGDMTRLKRTSYFPGLGWLLPRKVWEEQLAKTWPRSHWDHFLRDKRQHRGREVVHPEVPRDYHFGIKGTFMDKDTHNKYFKPIAMAANHKFSWFSTAGELALLKAATPAYSSYTSAALQKGLVLSSIQDIEQFEGELGVVYYSNPIEPNVGFRPMAAFFGIWHEPQRAARFGVTEIPWGRGKLLLVNTHPSARQGGPEHTLPPNARVLRGSEFSGRTRPAASLATTAANMPDAPSAPSDSEALRTISPLFSPQGESAFYAEQYNDFGWDPLGGLVKPGRE